MAFPVLAGQSLKTRITITTLIVFLVSVRSLIFYVGRVLRDDL
jgi:hypothetical protein